MVIGGTALKNKKYRIEDGKVIIDEDIFDAGLKEFNEDVAALINAQISVKFVELLKENIIMELRMIPIKTKQNLFLSGNWGNKGIVQIKDNLRSRIINALEITSDDKGKQSIVIKDIFKYDEYPLGQLAIALDQGTGEYGEHHRKITPKKGKFMFIPGIGYSSIFGSRNIGKYRTKYSTKGFRVSSKMPRTKMQESITKIRNKNLAVSKKIKGIYYGK